MSEMRIMFVCLGNICRSPLAHAVFDAKSKQRKLDDRFTTESSGTINFHEGKLPDKRMRATASSHGVHMTHRARHFTASDIDDYDLILTMDQENLANVQRLVTDDAALCKIMLFRNFDPAADVGAEVPDPYYGGAEGFEDVFQIVERTCDHLLNALEQETQ